MKFLILFALAAAVSAKAPNIVLMLGDDLGWNDVGWHDPKVKTPVMNELLKEGGIELDQYYVQPQCTPSRAALMTGLYPFHQGMQHGVIYPTQQECVSLSLKMLPLALKELGYDTHLCGKWHLGFCDKACTPIERGFDTFYGFLQGQNAHFTHLFGLGSMMGYDWRNGTELVPKEQTIDIHETDLLRERALEIIKNHNDDAPLFLNMMWGAPHQPFISVKSWEDMYSDVEDDEYRGYLGMISHLDDSIGKLVQAMKDKGLHENTIYIFMADNGGEAPIGLSMPHRGAKGSLFEGGIHSASWVHSPLLKKHNYKNEELMHVTDWYPTLVSMAGGSTEGLDGVDQTDMIINGGKSARSEFIVNIDTEWPWNVGKRAIRDGDFKLIHGYPGQEDGYGQDVQKTWRRCHWDMEEGWTGEASEEAVERRAADYTFSPEDAKKEENCIKESEDELRLFNVIEDVEERHNLAAEMPELVKELMAKLDKAQEGLVEVPYANTLSTMAGHPKNFDNTWSSGWCNGIPQANDPIVLHKEKMAGKGEVVVE